MRFFTLLALSFILTGSLHARQMAFQHKHQNGYVRLAYQWKMPGGTVQTAHVNLPQDAAEQGNREFVRFSNADANQYAYEALKKHVNAANIKGLTLRRSHSGYDIQYRGPTYNQPRVKQIMEEIEILQSKAFDDYVATSFYTYLEDDKLMPDHKRIAKRYIRAMRPVAEGLAPAMRAMNQRERINYLMHFLQSIPYDTLTSRYSSNGAGFQTPYGLLINNKGDCDTKAVALMALLRNFYPKMRMVMVYIEGHAFIGLNMRPQGGESALKLGGTTFVIADPTGPAQVKLGQPDNRALKALKSGKYSYQELGF